MYWSTWFATSLSIAQPLFWGIPQSKSHQLTHYQHSADFNVCESNTVEYTVYPKKYAHGFCFAMLCCGYTLTDFPISIRLTSLALWQSNDCPSASKATLMNMDKHFMWIHYERLRNHNKAKHNKTVCIFLGIYCTSASFVLNHVKKATPAKDKWTGRKLAFIQLLQRTLEMEAVCYHPLFYADRKWQAWDRNVMNDAC